MLQLFTLTLISLLFYGSDPIKLSLKDSKENLIQLKEKFSLVDEEGFYKGTSLSHSENGNYVLLDQGNKLLFVYDQTGKLRFSFGKEGNGPGELMTPFKVFTTKDRIFVRQHMKLNIFDFNGEHIKDVWLTSGGTAGAPIRFGNQLLIQYSGNSKEKYKTIDGNGAILATVKNENYMQPEAGTDNMSISLNSGFNLVYTGDGFFRSKKGEYAFDYLNKDMKVLRSYTRDFKRIERDPDRYNIGVDIEDDAMSKKEIARMKAKAISDAIKRMGVYEDDVSSILGYEKNRLFIKTAQKDLKEMWIDVIENDKLITQIHVKEKDDIKESRIENGMLLLNLKGKEEGAYAKVYELH